MQEKFLTFQEQTIERLFDKDSYLKEFQATVVSCEQKNEDTWQVVLDQTAFFPEGGGQSGDTGWLIVCTPECEMKKTISEISTYIAVTDIKEKAGVIYHETKKLLEEGTVVNGKIDFAERFDKMQQHTGEHILSGIVCATYGYHNVGFHLGAEITTLDFNGELSPEQVLDLEVKANEAIYENLPVQVLFPSKVELETLDYRSKIEIEGQVRIVEIPGVDRCACCAPHVKSTAEVGVIKILSCDRHRGGCRLTIVCGMRALKDYQKKQDSVGKISAALSAKPDKVAEAVTHLQEQQQSLREQLNRIQAMYLQEKIEKISAEDKYICIFEEALDSIAVRNFVNAAMERCDGICGAFMGSDQKGYHYILGSKTVDVREVSKKLNAQFSGKGGGKPQMVQGSLIGSKNEIREIFEEIG
ncbi:MAG: hypothetical protein IJ024_02650 [Lachnospiraceae bacterium]|nr:hypothetical protein [Lachnospiraceae bacterium]